jgi:uncharacterized protein
MSTYTELFRSGLRNSQKGYKCEIRYIRDDKGKECDFVFLRDRKPLFAVECKLNSSDISPSVLFLKSKLDIPMWYQVSMNEKTRIIWPDFKIMNFENFCKEVELI